MVPVAIVAMINKETASGQRDDVSPVVRLARRMPRREQIYFAHISHYIIKY